MNSNEILDIIIKSGLLSVLLGLVISLIKFAKVYLDNKTKETSVKIKEETVKKSIELVESCITTVVLELSQTIVDDLKDKSADGKLTDEEKVNIRNLAVEKVKQLMTDDVYTTLDEVFGSAEKWIIEKIEAEVKKIKSN